MLYNVALCCVVLIWFTLACLAFPHRVSSAWNILLEHNDESELADDRTTAGPRAFGRWSAHFSCLPLYLYVGLFECRFI